MKREPEKVTDKLRGILISDEALKERFEPPTLKPLNYGDVVLSEAEEKILNMPPKFTVYSRIDREAVAAASETMIDKLHWEMRAREEREGDPKTLESEWESVEAKTVHNEAEVSVDFSKQRVTDLPSCRRINVPEPVDNKTEIVFANIKARIATRTEEYITLKCDEKGNIKDQNLCEDELAAIKSLRKKVNNIEVVILPTDKSGRLSINTVVNSLVAKAQTLFRGERNAS